MTTSGRSVLVTGANGFVGRALVQRLIAAGHIVSALDTAPDAALPPGLQRFYTQDIGLPFEIAEPFDFVFHLAARNITHVGAVDYAELQRVNVNGSENVLRAVAAPDFVFMSTSKVYQQAGQPIDESSPTMPLADYERSKLEAEHALSALFAGKRLTIFRAVNIVGRGQAEKALVPVLFANAHAGRPLDIFAPKTSMLQLLHVADMTAACTALIDCGGCAGIFNLAPTAAIRLDALAERIVELAHSRSPVRYSNNKPAQYSPVLAHKAARQLQWWPAASINDILQECQLAYAHA